MRCRIGSLCIALGIILLVAALGLLIYNRWDGWRAGQAVADIQDALEDEEQSENFAETAGGGEYSGDGEMDTIEIDGYEYIGTLSIPDYGLKLPVMSEWSYPGLKIAPGRYSGSVWTDDLIICGHNYERHFGNLRYLEEGDPITFTDVYGNVTAYEVEEVIILRPTDVETMMRRENGEWDLTLFTCTIGGQTRVTVRCSRTDEQEN